MTTTATTIGLPSEPIVTKADAELATIREVQANVQAMIASAQDELHNAQERLQALQEERSSLEQEVQRLRADFDQVQTYARLATGTPSESTAVARLAACKKACSFAERTLSKFVTAHGNEETELPLRITELQTKMTQGEEQLGDLAQREQALRTARDQAFEALGQETFDAALASVHAAEIEVSTRAKALVEAKVRLSEVREEAERQLRSWQELHRRAISEHALLEDATVRVLRSYVNFLETLAHEGPEVAHVVNGYSLPAQVELTASFVEAIMGRVPGIEKQIANRRVGTLQLVEMYLKEC